MTCNHFWICDLAASYNDARSFLEVVWLELVQMLPDCQDVRGRQNDGISGNYYWSLS